MIRAIVTDIEGTTSDIQFVHQVLFPYARQHLAAYVRENHTDENVAAALNAVRAESAAPQATLEELITTLTNYIDEDRQSPGLKALQGMIWRAGYVEGQFTGHLYPDVLPAFARWQQQGSLGFMSQSIDIVVEPGDGAAALVQCTGDHVSFIA